MSVSNTISNMSISIKSSSEDDEYKLLKLSSSPGVMDGNKKSICKVVLAVAFIILVVVVGYLYLILSKDPWVS